MNCKLHYNYTEMSAIDYAIHYKYPEAALGASYMSHVLCVMCTLVG